MTIFSEYVSREADLGRYLNDLVRQPSEAYYNGRIQGWDRYYADHYEYLESLWKALPKEQRQQFKQVASQSSFLPLTGGDSSDIDARIRRAAKRVMARDWHKGLRYFAQPGAVGGERSGLDYNLDTYTVLGHGSVNGTPVRNEIRLNSAGNDYKDQDAVENAYNTFGTSHWYNNGINEARALPGPKFTVSNGKVVFNDKLVGSKLQPNYQNIANSFNESKGGNYKQLMEGALNGLPSNYATDLIDFDANGNLTNDAAMLTGFYSNYKVNRYDSSKGAKPPKGNFDAAYYATENQYGRQAMEEWNANSNNVFADLGINLPNLDYTQGYATVINGLPYDFLVKKYTDIKSNPSISDLDNRANAAVDTELADAVAETWNTFDQAEKDAFQKKLLGLDKQGASGQYYVDFDNPYVVDEEGNTVYETDEFGNQTPQINPANLSYLESSVFNVFGKKDLEQQDRFQALALDVLKNSVDELNKQRDRERELNIYKGLPGFNEIYGANSSIANSLLGDSGIGGYLSMMGQNVDKLSEDLEKQLGGVTGISNNSSVYNWQKWFNDTLLDRYQNLEEITGKLSADIEGLDPILNETQWNSFKTKINAATEGTEEYKNLLKDNNLALGLSKERALEIKDPNNWKSLLEKYDLSPDLTKDQALDIFKDSSKDINRIYTIESEFRDKFIDDYIKPRFDQSKSMDEFVSYLDTLDEDEQNVFQTQDALQELKNVANAYSVAKLQTIQNMGPSLFNADFYFDPTTAIDSRYEGAKDEAYRQQKEAVAADWETAKNNPNAMIPGTESAAYPNGFSWYQYAYYYGLDLNDKADFARLHHDVVGYRKNFDAAKDITSVGDIRAYISDVVLPKVAEAKLEIGDAAFSEFTTPEEYADYLLEGIDPTENKPEWKEILERFGLDDDATLDEVKDYIIDATRTGAAKDIRESIKFLNERKLTPTQERLGVSYIERPEDAKDVEDEDASALYKIFADAGYTGTEDEFFTNFMPDVDRGDIELITAGLGGADKFQLTEIKDDPFEALSSVSSFFDDGTDAFGNEPKEETTKSNDYDYFSLFDDKDDYKSDAGRDYISEYKTFFS